MKFFYVGDTSGGKCKDAAEHRGLSVQLQYLDEFSLWHNKQLHTLNQAEKRNLIVASLLVLLFACILAWPLWSAA